MYFLKFQSYVLRAKGRSGELTQEQIKTKKSVEKEAVLSSASAYFCCFMHKILLSQE